MQAFAPADFHGGEWPYRVHFYAGQRKAGFEDAQLWQHWLTTLLAEQWV